MRMGGWIALWSAAAMAVQVPCVPPAPAVHPALETDALSAAPVFFWRTLATVARVLVRRRFPSTNYATSERILEGTTGLRFLITSLGSYGDLHPLLEIGEALQARGHRVTVMANQHFKRDIRARNFDFIQLGTEAQYRELADDPKTFQRKTATAVFLRALVPAFRLAFNEAIEFWKLNPSKTIFISNRFAGGIPIAAHVTGSPSVTVAFSPYAIPSVIKPPIYSHLRIPARLPAWVKRLLYLIIDYAVDRIWGPPLNALRAEYDLDPISCIMNDAIFSRDLVLLLTDPSFAERQADWPANLVQTGFIGASTKTHVDSKQLRNFLYNGRDLPDPRPVVFYMGSANAAERIYELAATVCASMNLRAVIIDPMKRLTDAASPHIYVTPWVELGAVFRHASVAVHHGGIGTIAQALAVTTVDGKKGIPQVVIPGAHDQFHNAHVVDELQIGIQLPVERLDETSLRRALGRAMHSRTIRQNVSAIAALTDPEAALGRAVHAIERLIQDRQRPALRRTVSVTAA